jgi:ATP/maltotriose-dependent transcriptional regulator MalT
VRALRAADASGALEPDDLVKLAQACYWTGSLDEYLALLERAFAAYVRAGDHAAAALIALMLQWDFQSKPARSLANGWRRRAERLLQDRPECLAHGYLAQARCWVALAAGDVDGALHEAGTMIDVGARLGSPELHTLGLQRRGQALLARGDVATGMACTDEAVVAALSGELDTMTTAAVYCAAITCCRQLADYERAGEWSAAVTRWCAREGCTGFPGLCRIYTAELAGLRGDWAQAQQDLRRACEELQRFGAFAMAADGFYELGELRRRTGDLEGAEAAYDQAYEYGLDPQPGQALVLLARGDLTAARTVIARALADPGASGPPAEETSGRATDQLRRARLLPAQVEIALAAGDPATASAATVELEAIASTYDTAALRAQACFARAQVAHAEGDLAAALAAATRARTLWQVLEMPHPTARALVLEAAIHRAAGDAETAQIAVRTAHATFERLGAEPERAAAAAQLAPAYRTRAAPGRLSPRELDVLRLVADGLTDGEIARRLVLSPHTVHRHIANIRTKTRQPSRAAAVAHATRLGVL